MKKVEKLAAKVLDMFLRRWWRPNLELKESEYWTYIHHMTPNESYRCNFAHNINSKSNIVQIILKFRVLSQLVCQYNIRGHRSELSILEATLYQLLSSYIQYGLINPLPVPSIKQQT